ncbi:exopolysaccharide transport family protein [Pedobacter montanisoli]|uniref:Lipopolysaccharide biosynthesis protein n=1 Tax=Pedobacter montanisoli TaxID=2923277 RepID=A0ABS9ZSQ4_9SPHI|nr:lipopolysaccharide biosynthesis protein [Pedobacter montanisoli]MCJ0741617.1 lipopolysaccharide biosynthesis protein [Pedobacter montanisoli]
MNIREFLNLIARYKWLIIAIPTITLCITYLLVKNLPKEYKSQAKLSTGLLDPSRQVAPDVPSYSGPDLLIKINQQFTNIMDIMAMPKNMSILSYRLILHDLKNPQKPFKPLSDDVKALSENERQEAIRLFEERLAQKQVLTPLDNYHIKLYNLVKSMGYDAKTLSRKLSISHEDNSDFVTVEFTSNNTFLSVFVVNTLSRDFINNYSFDLISNKNKSITVLDSLLKKKEGVMNDKNQQLKEYKIKNRVLNLDKQSQIVYQQIIDYENKKSQALIDLQSLQSALNNVNKNLQSRDQDKYLGAELSQDNQTIISLKNKIHTAENDYIDGGFLAKDKKKVDSLQQLLNAQLVKSNDNYVSDPLVAKQSLILRRISLGVDLDKTRASIKDIDDELAKLNAKFTTMVPFDAGVQKYERDADVATKEYLDILNRYNQTNLDKNIGLRLQLEQEGVPTSPEASKKVIYMALAAIASFAICFFILLIIHVFDHSINDQKQLEEATNNKVIGELNHLKSDSSNIHELWKTSEAYKDRLMYKNQLRHIRFEVNKILAKEDFKILGITSLKPDKYYISSVTSLAYAFARLNKQVLLIGNNEVGFEAQKLNVPTNQSVKAVFQDCSIQKNKHITYLNSDLEGFSLLEKNDKNNLTQSFNKLKKEFDLIIICLEPLNTVNDMKEWTLFTEKYLATFMAGNSISEKDKEAIKDLSEDNKFIGWLIDGVKRNKRTNA